jgi:membrane protease YdiL (CAAX protease family)
VRYGEPPFIPQPPPDPPERPEGASPWPRWPWWYAPVGLLVALAASLLLGGLIGGAILAASGEEDIDSPAFLISATLVQDAIFVGTALWFAARTQRPRREHFGLRPTRLWPALGWAALAFVSFVVFAAVYSAVVDVDEQSTIDDLGAEESTLALVASALLVIVLAPVVEEFFFRGFMYRALRTRMGVLAAAAVDGGLFGLIHSTSGVDAVPILVVLGVTFCLVYERTGSLYPVIALHAFNNAIAYGVGTESGWLSAGLGLAVIAGCVLAPRVSARRPAPAVT